MFNFIASALMVYLLVNVLKVARADGAGDRATSPRAPSCPSCTRSSASFGITMSRTPLNFTVVPGARRRLPDLGADLAHPLRLRDPRRRPSEPAAVYAGINPVRIIIITMLISGALAGLMAVNVILGDQHRLVLDFVGGAGFVGIAVALMGRSHPVGIVLAAILFGMLYQGGAELAFDMPAINRDMIVVIQGLVILFTGALENLFRPPVERAFLASRAEGRLMDLYRPAPRRLHPPARGAADPRLPRRPLLRALRHLRHRPRRQDAGRRLRRRRGRRGHRLRLDRAPRRHLASLLLALVHGYASITPAATRSSPASPSTSSPRA